jgi:hypothetical protein
MKQGRRISSKTNWQVQAAVIAILVGLHRRVMMMMRRMEMILLVAVELLFLLCVLWQMMLVVACMIQLVVVHWVHQVRSSGQQCKLVEVAAMMEEEFVEVAQEKGEGKDEKVNKVAVLHSLVAVVSIIDC